MVIMYNKDMEKEERKENTKLPNRYDKMTPAQKEHWAKYSREYHKRNFKAYNISINKTKESDIIEFIDNNGPVSTLFKRLVRDEIKRKG